MFRTLRPLLLVLALVMSLPAQARDAERGTDSEREDAGDRVREVERDGGRVLQAEPMQHSGREVYRLKVLTPEGRVRVLDASRARPDREPRERREPPPAPERRDNPRPVSGADDGPGRSSDH